ncbi:MAG: acyl--CoA ligase [Pseudomonadaceae bacterium]|nr:acyl--CoA ligase [Pseudomonadaceae bacterium]
MTLTRKEALAQLTAPGQPHELQPLTINNVPCRVFANAPQSLRELFADNVSDATFMVYEDERYTFAQMYTQASQLATALVNQYDVSKGDRVAISMRNYPEWVVGFTAATSIGAIAVAMNAWWESHEIAEGLNDCGAKVILADRERLERLGSIIDQVDVQVIAVRPGDGDHPGTDIKEVLAQQPADCQMPEVEVLPEDPATIFYTSGSTGFPKGAVSTHRNVLSALLSWELDQLSAMLIAGVEPPEPENQPATLLAVPLFHATGSHAVFLSSYRSQRKLVSMYKWDADAAAALIEQEKISSFVAPAAMTGDLVLAAKVSRYDLSSLQTVGGGGAPRAPEQVKDIKASITTAMPNTGWGMTETNAIGTGIGGEDYLNRPASSGRASAVVDLKIIDEEGNELPPGQRGELLIRGVSVIQGYWRRPEANAETFVDGWLRTGDVAYLDDEGYLFIVDRIKDLIIRGGENIGCGEVEAALVEHPLVIEACVYAIPDERLGEAVGATVYAQQGLLENDLRQFLSAHLAKFKIPAVIQIVLEPLPRIASGKIYKRQLRDQTIAAMAEE